MCMHGNTKMYVHVNTCSNGIWKRFVSYLLYWNEITTYRCWLSFRLRAVDFVGGLVLSVMTGHEAYRSCMTKGQAELGEGGVREGWGRGEAARDGEWRGGALGTCYDPIVNCLWSLDSMFMVSVWLVDSRAILTSLDFTNLKKTRIYCSSTDCELLYFFIVYCTPTQWHSAPVVCLRRTPPATVDTVQNGQYRKATRAYAHAREERWYRMRNLFFSIFLGAVFIYIYLYYMYTCTLVVGNNAHSSTTAVASKDHLFNSVAICLYRSYTCRQYVLAYFSQSVRTSLPVQVYAGDRGRERGGGRHWRGQTGEEGGRRKEGVSGRRRFKKYTHRLFFCFRSVQYLYATHSLNMPPWMSGNALYCTVLARHALCRKGRLVGYTGAVMAVIRRGTCLSRERWWRWW